MKKVMIVCLILLGLIVIGVVGNYTAHENVTFVHSDDGRYVLYQANEYYPAPFFTATKYLNTANEGDVELGWYYSFPFSTRFYSYTSENPVYIYALQSGKGVYLKQGYDYKSDAYRIEDTSRTIVLSEAVTGADVKHDYAMDGLGTIELNLYSESHPMLKLSVQLFSENNVWYAQLSKTEAYRISESFLDLLEETGVIEK